jgi:O-antigen/teichoic acid export membrane protein
MGAKMSLRHQVTTGAAWSLAATALQRAIQVGAVMVLARLLTQKEYGVVALGLVVARVLYPLAEAVSQAVIYAPGDKNRHANAGLALMLVVTGATVALGWAAAPFVAAFFGEPGLKWLTCLLVAAFAIGAPGRIPASLLERELAFRRRFVPEVVPTMAYAGVAIGFALKGVGAISLAYGELARATTYTALSWLALPWKPTRDFDREAVAELVRFARYILLALFGFLVFSNLDNVYVGRLLGVAPVGAYALAYTFASAPGSLVAVAVGRVMFPAYGQLRGNADRLRLAYLLTLRHVCLICLPMVVGMVLLLPDFFHVAYGHRWEEAILPAQILSVFGLGFALGATASSLLKATGKPEAQALSNIVQAVGVAVLGYIGARVAGLVGVSVAVVLSTSMGVAVVIQQTRSCAAVNARDYAVEAAPGALAAAGGAAALVAARLGLRPALSPLWFVFECLVFAAAWGALAWLLRARMSGPDSGSAMAREVLAAGSARSPETDAALEFCEAFGYPPRVRTDLSDIVAAVSDLPGLRCVLLCGSTARGEMSWLDAAWGTELLSDYEFLALTQKRVSRRRLTITRRRLLALEEQFAMRSPLFHIDIACLPVKAAKRISRHVRHYEVRVNARVLWGSDLRDALPEISPTTLDLHACNDILVDRMWALLVHQPASWLRASLDDFTRQVWAYAVSRNLLDMVTWWLPHQGVLLPSYRQRIAYLAEHDDTLQVDRLFGAGFLESVQRAELVKRRAALAEEPETLYPRVVSYLGRALEWLMKQHGISYNDAVEGMCEALPRRGGAIFAAPRLLYRGYDAYLVLRCLPPWRWGHGFRWWRRRRLSDLAAALLALHLARAAQIEGKPAAELLEAAWRRLKDTCLLPIPEPPPGDEIERWLRLRRALVENELIVSRGKSREAARYRALLRWG